MTEHPESNDNEMTNVINQPTRRRRFLWLSVCVGLVFILGSAFFLWYGFELAQPPATFPTNVPVVIEQGTEVRQITQELAANNVVKSADLLYFVLVFSHDPSQIKASTYVFDTPLDVFAVANRLTEGDFDTDLLRFTHIEGERVELLAERADAVLPEFDTERFLVNAIPLEGTLFPDTYFIPVTFSDEDLLLLLTDTYQERIESLRSKIDQSEYSEEEILIMASIIEREANTPESKQYVAGIFQNRLEIGMALQADATIEYVLDTPLHELPEGQLAEELREVDSPYNTYLYPGLPPSPIGNPGLTAIEAVLNPIESDYFYYITGSDGEFYYAETYDGHLNNIERYLR